MSKQLYVVKDKDGFTNSVFGADCFLKFNPEISTTGVELKQIGKFYYIIENGEPVNDTAFFSQEEMQYLQRV